MHTEIIPVDGMTCKRCVASLENILGQLVGVTQVKVTLEPAGQVEITYDTQQILRAAIEEAIENAGFDVVTR